MSSLRFAPRTFARAFSNTRSAQVSRVTLIGRLAATPELFTTQSGKEIIRYNVGVNRGYGDNQQTAWWKVSSFAESGGKLGEKMLNLPKGTQVFVEGDIWQSKYEGQDGQVKDSVQIVQTKMEVLRRPAGADGGEAASSQAAGEA